MYERLYIAQLDRDCWAVDGRGTRTVVLDNAKRFKSYGAARSAITWAKKSALLRSPKILRQDTDGNICVDTHL